MGNEMCTLKHRVPKSKGATVWMLNSLCPHKGLGLNPGPHVGPPAQWVPLPGRRPTDRCGEGARGLMPTQEDLFFINSCFTFKKKGKT